MIRVLLVVLALALLSCESAPRQRSFERQPDGYAPASDATRSEVVRAVEEYYALRARAIAAGDAAILHARYPRLATGEDRERLVNVDGWFIERMRSGRIRTVTTKLEDREPIRVYVKGDRAAALVHGRFDWIESGTAGEFYTRLDLERDGTWTVVRVDEVSDAEAHEP